MSICRGSFDGSSRKAEVRLSPVSGLTISNERFATRIRPFLASFALTSASPIVSPSSTIETTSQEPARRLWARSSSAGDGPCDPGPSPVTAPLSNNERIVANMGPGSLLVDDSTAESRRCVLLQPHEDLAFAAASASLGSRGRKAGQFEVGSSSRVPSAPASVMWDRRPTPAPAPYGLTGGPGRHRSDARPRRSTCESPHRPPAAWEPAAPVNRPPPTPARVSP